MASRCRAITGTTRRSKAGAARITADHGRLDLLVNNAWAGYERLNAGAWEEWNAPLGLDIT